MTKKERYEDSKLAYAALMQFYPLTLDDLDGELWHDFNGYLVSTFGRVKSFYHKQPLILSPGLGSSGYLFVNLTKDRNCKIFQVHRLVALCFIPNPLNKPQVNHRDGCKLNNFVSNLEWATASENLKHAIDTGLKTSPSKVSPQQVQFIRDNPLGLTGRQLAALFGVKPTTIHAIQTGKSWERAGGNVREPNKHPGRKLQDDIRDKIRAEYQRGVRGFGSYALAKKYNVSEATIRNILRELSC